MYVTRTKWDIRLDLTKRYEASQGKDDGKDARKQYDWLNVENVRAARAYV